MTKTRLISCPCSNPIRNWPKCDPWNAVYVWKLVAAGLRLGQVLCQVDCSIWPKSNPIKCDSYDTLLTNKCYHHCITSSVHDDVYAGFHGTPLGLVIPAQWGQFHRLNSRGQTVIRVKWLVHSSGSLKMYGAHQETELSTTLTVRSYLFCNHWSFKLYEGHLKLLYPSILK